MTKVIAIIQARMRSSRLPGKVMAEIAGRPSIAHTVTRAQKAQRIDEVWLACSQAVADDPLAAFVKTLGVPVFRGDEDDVLGRYVAVTKETGADVIVRLTGDCPMVAPDVVDKAVERFLEGGADYVSNGLERTYPDGLDVEVFSSAALFRADVEAREPFLRQHVTPYIHGRLRDRLPCGNFKTAQITHEQDYSHLRWTLDEPDDLAFLCRLLPMLKDDYHWLDAVAVMTRDPDLFWINRKHGINEGTVRDLETSNTVAGRAMSFDRSNQMFARAMEVIPLASQTFSKSYQQWVLRAAPLFLDKGAGCRVSDVDGNIFIDYIQGLMPNILGYCDPDVDAAIREQLEKGITFSLPSPLETNLAEKLIEEIPCAEMVRFGKNGSDATSAAIRLARAYTGRDRVIACGYHGWHDWYIGTTTRKLGVPADVSSLTDAIAFNDANAIEDTLKVAPDAYAAIILEPTGAQQPDEGYLQTLKTLADRYGVVLVFDEIVTGFRIHKGGAQAYFGVTPDIACFGKAMANGMPISAVVGRKEIMQCMEDIFFSGTFGGEALSLAASIATIAKLERECVIDRLWARGDALIEGSNAAFDANGFGGVLEFYGDGWWPRLRMTDLPVEPVLMTSLLRQEFVAEGLLLASSFNLSLAHDRDDVMTETLDSMDRALANVRSHLDSSDPASRLRGEPVQPTFSVR